MTKKTFVFFAQDRKKIKSKSVKKLSLLRDEVKTNSFSTACQHTHLGRKSSMLNNIIPSICNKRIIHLSFLSLRYLICCQSLKDWFRNWQAQNIFRTWQYNCKKLFFFLSSANFLISTYKTISRKLWWFDYKLYWTSSLFSCILFSLSNDLSPKG